MPLPVSLATNVLVNVYRGCNPASPMPGNGTIPALANVPGFLKQHMKLGRFGKSTANVHWTHKLLLNVVDVRDAYNAEMTAGPAELVQNGDTVLIQDYLKPGQSVPTIVVAANRKRSRTFGDILQVYLDRFLPGTTPNPAIVATPCCPLGLPEFLTATFHNVNNAPCLDGQTLSLVWSTNQNYWQASTPVPACVAGGTLSLILQWNSPPLAGACQSFVVTGNCAAPSGSGLFGPAFPDSCSCYPFSLRFNSLAVQPGPLSCCSGGGNVSLTITP
jgi:hypothetical protein